MQVLAYAVDGWGIGELYLDGGRLLHHELPRMDTSGSLTPGHGGNGLVRRMEAYFAGERVSFEDVEVDLSWATPFQRSLAGALRGIPYGEVVTYGELAALAGRPTAPRAAGTFCAGNRFPLVVPCHRVVAASGIGGYGSLGTQYKRRLLALEGIVA